MPLDTIERIARRPDDDGLLLGDDQAAALAAVALSGRIVDVLVGPAGAGKTTALAALQRAWEAAHGPGSVVGLAPSAAAAQVLGEDLRIGTDTLAKWLHEHDHERAAHLLAGQLVVVDEASLGGTLALHRVAIHAAAVGAKVLLVGDWAQLAAVEAGGAFGLLVRERDDAPELTDVRRLQQPWEQDATLQLRFGNAEAIDVYQQHDRLRAGDGESMLDAGFTAWQHDVAAGRNSVMIAPTNEVVTALNQRARCDRIAAGEVAADHAITLRDSNQASAGDLVVTRRNDRRLVAGKGWVRNGDRWIVTATNDDGSVTLRRVGGTVAVVLPAGYVAEHLDLGYATTAHRAQGSTVDTAHVIVQPGMSREGLYVAMTRGREANTAYVAIDQPEAEPHQQPTATPDDGRAVLLQVLGHVAAEPSAHEAIEQEQQRWTGIAQLAAEYETLASAAQHDRWAALLQRCPLSPGQVDQVVGSDTFPALAAQLRLAEANHHDVDALLPRLAAPNLDEGDPAQVLARHLAAATKPQPGSRLRRPPRMIAGLIPQARGPLAPQMREALDQRHHLIEQRAHALLEQALAERSAWARHLGAPPRDAPRRQAWERLARTVAAYRDRYDITTDNPLGPAPDSTQQRIDAARANAALHRATRLTNARMPDRATTPITRPRKTRDLTPRL